MIKKYIDKYRTLPLGVKAAFWFIVCSAVQSGASFLSMPFLVRLLSTEEYGIYCVFRSWINIIAIFSTFKMSTDVFNNAMFKYPEKRNEYTSSAQSISITGVLISLTVYFLFNSFWNKVFGMPGEISIMIFVHLFFTESYFVWTAKQRYEYKYKKLVVSTVAFSLLYFIVPIMTGYFTDESRRLTAVIYSGVAVQVSFGLGFMIYNYCKGKCFFKKEYWKFALSFNLPLIPHFLSTMILGESDRVMIKSMVGASEAGIYSFTYTVAIVINIVTESVRNALIPFTYKSIEKKEFSNLRTTVNMLLIGVGALIIMFAAVAPEFISIFATEEYYDAVKLVPVISLSSFFGFLYGVFSIVEFFFGANKLVTVASVIGAAANIVLNAVFIPVFGYYAAGYTTFACYVLYSLVHYAFMKRVCKKELNGAAVYDNKTILIISMVVTVAAFGMLLIYDYWIVRYAVLAVCFGVIFIKRKAFTNIKLK